MPTTCERKATVVDELEPTATPAGSAETARSGVFAQGMRYLLVGGSSAALELAVFWTLSSPLDVDVRVSNVIAVFAATVYNFLVNRQWTFNASSHWARSAVLYLTLWSVNLVFTTTVIVYADGQGFNATLAKMGTMAVITLWNFWLFRKVVFV